MGVTSGSLSARLWRVNEAIPARFDETFERNLKRHSFRPVAVERGELRSHGWTNVRQMLDTDLSLDRVLFGGIISMGLRVDRISVNPKLFKARLQQEIDKAMRGAEGKGRLSDEKKTAIEDKVRLELLKAAPPSISLYEMAWRLETGMVVFASTGAALNQVFADLFQETFNLTLEPQFPFFRAQRWARRESVEHVLRDALPAPFSPYAPAEVHEVSQDGGEE